MFLSERLSSRSATRSSPRSKLKSDSASGATERITPEDLPALTEKGANVNRAFIVAYAGHDYNVKVKPGKIMFLDNDKTETPCIQIDIYEQEVHLSYYYLQRKIRTDCPLLDHKLFFKFLRKLGEVYERSVTLDDYSRHDYENTFCMVYGYLFSLAGKPTFYERFGFRNPTYTKEIKTVQKMTLTELMDAKRTLRRSNRLDPTLPKAKRAIESFGMTMDSTVKELASFLIQECKAKDVYNKEFIRRGYDTWNSENRPMVRTRKYNKPEQQTKTHEMVLKWLDRRIKSSFAFNTFFTME
jgi:hypothetical protein